MSVQPYVEKVRKLSSPFKLKGNKIRQVKPATVTACDFSEKESLATDESDGTKPALAATSQHLVLQMYSHMKSRHKLEKDIQNKVTRMERRRQQMKKKGLAASSSFTASDGFFPRWGYTSNIHARYVHLGARKDIATSVPSSGRSKQAEDVSAEPSKDAGSMESSGLLRPARKNFPGQYRPGSQGQTVGNSTSAPITSPPSHFPLTHRSWGDAPDPYHDNNKFNVIRGPGRIKISFRGMNKAPGQQSSTGKSNLDWDNAPKHVASHLSGKRQHYEWEENSPRYTRPGNLSFFTIDGDLM